MLNYLNQRTGAVMLSVASNSLLIALKLVIGLATGSVSIISEAIHSSTDLIAAIIAFFAIRSAARPADANHQYGHAKAESLAAGVEALLIVLAAVLIIYEAARRLYFGSVIENVDWGIAVMLFSSLMNFAVSRHLFRVAKRTESPALTADAWHLATDLYTALGVTVGLVLVRVTGVKAFDPLVAIGVALFILKAAWDITRGSMADLLDESLPAADEQRIRDIVEAHRGLFSNIRLMRTRRAGGGRHAYVALEFPPSVSISDAHEVTSHLEKEIQREFPRASVVIEAEAPKRAESPQTVIQMVKDVAQRLGDPVHHISAYSVNDRFNVTLHLEVNAALSLTEAHALATRLEDELRREIPRLARVDTHIEPVTSETLTDQDRAFAGAQVEQALRVMMNQVPQLRDAHDVQVHRTNGDLSVTLHLPMEGTVPIGEAHRLSSEIEAGLKRQLPKIQSVVVHTEPRE